MLGIIGWVILSFRIEQRLENLLHFMSSIVVEHSRTSRARIYAIIGLYLYQIAHYIYLHFANLTELERFIHADVAHFCLNQKNSFASKIIILLLLGMLGMLSICFHYLFFLQTDPQLFEIISYILGSSCQSTARRSAVSARELYLHQHYKGRDVYQLIRSVSSRIFSALQLFTVMIGMLLLLLLLFLRLCVIHKCMCCQITYLSFLCPTYAVLLIICFHVRFLLLIRTYPELVYDLKGCVAHLVNMLLFDLAMMHFASVGISAAWFGLVSLVGVYIRVDQNVQQNLSPIIKRGNYGISLWHKIAHFIRFNVHTLEMLLTGDRTYGKLLLTFLLINTPINAYIVMLLMLGQVRDVLSLAFYYCLAFQQLSCIFVMHFYIALFSKRLHGAAKPLFTILVRNLCKIGNFRAKLTLTHTIMCLHTENKYGISYGPMFGLVTLTAFAKCLLLYGEFLMYAYQLV